MNILFITEDQWRGECLSVLWHPLVKTPNLDEFAGEGVLFRNHYANIAPCAPSRATMHTGMYLHNHRIIQNGTPLNRRHSNWAIESKRAGYRSVLFGYTDTSVDPIDTNPLSARADGIEYEDGGKYPWPSAYPKADSDTRFLVDLLIDWLENDGKSGAPWAVHLSLLRPRLPWVAPKPYNQLISGAIEPAKT